MSEIEQAYERILSKQPSDRASVDGYNQATSSNMKSLDRKLDQKLVLMVRQNFDDKRASPWILPQRKNSNETLRHVSVHL